MHKYYVMEITAIIDGVIAVRAMTQMPGDTFEKACDAAAETTRKQIRDSGHTQPVTIEVVLIRTALLPDPNVIIAPDKKIITGH